MLYAFDGLNREWPFGMNKHRVESVSRFQNGVIYNSLAAYYLTEPLDVSRPGCKGPDSGRVVFQRLFLELRGQIIKVTLVEGLTLSDEESRIVLDFKVGRISAFDLAQRLDALRIKAGAQVATP